MSEERPAVVMVYDEETGNAIDAFDYAVIEAMEAVVEEAGYVATFLTDSRLDVLRWKLSDLEAVKNKK